MRRDPGGTARARDKARRIGTWGTEGRGRGGHSGLARICGSARFCKTGGEVWAQIAGVLGLHGFCGHPDAFPAKYRAFYLRFSCERDGPAGGGASANLAEPRIAPRSGRAVCKTWQIRKTRPPGHGSPQRRRPSVACTVAKRAGARDPTRMRSPSMTHPPGCPLWSRPSKARAAAKRTHPGVPARRPGKAHVAAKRAGVRGLPPACVAPVWHTQPREARPLGRP